MSDLCSPRKSNGLLNYFMRLEPPKRTSLSNSDLKTEEPNLLLDSEVEIGRGAQDFIEEVEKEELVTSGAKRKRSYTKRGNKQSEGSSKKTRPRHHSDAHEHDSDSDFEHKEIVKRPKRKFASALIAVKSISSYFESQPPPEETKSTTEGIKIVEGCYRSENKNIIKNFNDPSSSEHRNDIEIANVPSSCEDRNDTEIINEPVSAKNNNDEIVEKSNNSEFSANKNDTEIEQAVGDTPARRRSSRIQYIEERKEKELEKRKQLIINVKVTRPRKRLQIDSESENSVADSEQGSEDLSDFIDSDNGEHFQKNKMKSKKVKGKIPLMFLTGKEREKELLRLEKEKKPLQKELDAETVAFLHSGVPAVVLKAQQQVEKKQEFDDFLNTVEFFPRISHTEMVVSDMTVESPNGLNGLCFKERNINNDVPTSCSWKEFFVARKTHGISNTLDNGIFCCGNTSFVRFNSTLDIETSCGTDSPSNSEMPWLEKYKVGSKKDVVVDKDAFGKLEKWLKQWKTDIKDDGGTGRKEIRKRRKDSDSDFVISDEEDHDFMNKSVLLCGSSGCGKTTAVYALAKHLGFYVVEVNFSSRRSGKEVMQSVEEATLSHRIESSESCLLLFKDIDLMYPEEDEGFHAAVAQLISSSCRPIVMTTQESIYSPLDSKIEKKDPLRIHFDRPSPSAIVKKVLVPMCKSSVLNLTELNEKVLVSGLDSLVRHLHCDIRLSINQAQLLCFDTFFTTENIHKHCNQIENCIDLDFVCKTKKVNDPAQDNIKVDKKKLVSDLDKLSKDLSLLADIELISTKYRRYDHRDESTSNFAINYREHLEQFSKILGLFHKNNFNAVERTRSINSFEISFDSYRKLALINDDEDLLNGQVSVLSEELGSYCDDFDDWQSRACVRTIVKTNAINSVGRSAKRNGRMAFYFNRLDTDLVNKIYTTFGFAQELEITKMFAPG